MGALAASIRPCYPSVAPTTTPGERRRAAPTLTCELLGVFDRNLCLYAPLLHGEHHALRAGGGGTVPLGTLGGIHKCGLARRTAFCPVSHSIPRESSVDMPVDILRPASVEADVLPCASWYSRQLRTPVGGRGDGYEEAGRRGG